MKILCILTEPKEDKQDQQPQPDANEETQHSLKYCTLTKESLPVYFQAVMQAVVDGFSQANVKGTQEGKSLLRFSVLTRTDTESALKKMTHYAAFFSKLLSYTKRTLFSSKCVYCMEALKYV